jgi:N-acyl-D-aspartate/D-glutamate deacylase
MYDLVLKKGKIIDGTANCRFCGDMGILNGRTLAEMNEHATP